MSEAVALLRSRLKSLTDSELVPVHQVRNRVCAEPVRAPGPVPPFRASAMDGYALASGTLSGRPPYTLQVAGEASAGHPFPGTIHAGQCIRILTGAEVPEGADTVVIQEEVSLLPGTGGHPAIRVEVLPAAGDNIREPGDDVPAGHLLASPGDLLGPFDVGRLTAAGIQNVTVVRPVRVALFSTGDELVEPGQALGPGQIYDSNRFLVEALCRNLPVQVRNLGVLPDLESAVSERLADAADWADCIITSGGVSVGDADVVKKVIESQGQLSFWRLNLKPGKPVAVGSLGRAWIFGLPGNPVSTAITFLLLAQPALLQLAGAGARDPLPIPAILTAPIEHRAGREEYQRGRAQWAETGLEVMPTGTQGSNRLDSFREANCLIQVPKMANDLSSGQEVRILLLSDLS